MSCSWMVHVLLFYCAKFQAYIAQTGTCLLTLISPTPILGHAYFMCVIVHALVIMKKGSNKLYVSMLGLNNTKSL